MKKEPITDDEIFINRIYLEKMRRKGLAMEYVEAVDVNNYCRIGFDFQTMRPIYLDLENLQIEADNYQRNVNNTRSEGHDLFEIRQMVPRIKIEECLVRIARN